MHSVKSRVTIPQSINQPHSQHTDYLTCPPLTDWILALIRPTQSTRSRAGSNRFESIR